jgi:hypothetical protein
MGGRDGIREWVWRALIIVLAFILAAIMPSPIGSAAEAEGHSEVANTGPANIVLPQILAPMVTQNRLLGYAYITVGLAPSGQDKVGVIREKLPFLQDAFLREVNRASIAKPGDIKTVDADEVKNRLQTRMAAILPAGTVTELKIEQVTVVMFGS